MITTELIKLVINHNNRKGVNNIFSKIFTYKMAEAFSNIIYKSLNSVLVTLHEEQYQHLDSVRELVSIYNKFVQEQKETKNEEKIKKYPLIVLEGLDGCGKSTITKRLSKRLNAELMCTPPPCISNIRKDFDTSEYKDVRTAFYSLGNYVAASQIMEILETRPVVLDRFWHSTVAYAVAQSIADYPHKYKILPKNHHLYEWPEDLLKPDLIVFLNVSESVRLIRMRNRSEYTSQETLLKKQEFRNSVTDVYNRINPSMKYVNANLKKREVEDTIVELVQPLMPEN